MTKIKLNKEEAMKEFIHNLVNQPDSVEVGQIWALPSWRNIVVTDILDNGYVRGTGLFNLPFMGNRRNPIIRVGAVDYVAIVETNRPIDSQILYMCSGAVPEETIKELRNGFKESTKVGLYDENQAKILAMVLIEDWN